MTSSISSLVRIWKCHSGPERSFVWVVRTVYFPVKQWSCLYNQKDQYTKTNLNPAQVPGTRQERIAKPALPI